MLKTLQDRLRFRPAKEAGVLWHVVRTAVQASLCWLLFFGAFPLGVHLFEVVLLKKVVAIPTLTFAGQRPLAIGLFALWGALNLWAGATMAIVGKGTPFPLDTARELVVKGPYRFVRNPMALGGLGAGMAIALYLGSLLWASVVVAGGILWHVVARPPEEADLEARFGESYAHYKREVRNWVPRVLPFTADAPPKAPTLEPPC